MGIWALLPLVGAAPELIPGPQVRHGLSEGFCGMHQSSHPAPVLQALSYFPPSASEPNEFLLTPAKNPGLAGGVLHLISAYFLRASGPPSRKVPRCLDLSEKTYAPQETQFPHWVIWAAYLRKASLSLSLVQRRTWLVSGGKAKTPGKGYPSMPAPQEPGGDLEGGPGRWHSRSRIRQGSQLAPEAACLVLSLEVSSLG